MEFDFNDEPSSVSPEELDILVEALRQRIKESEFAGSLVPVTEFKFLSTFIRIKDYNLDKAFTSIQRYYACLHRNHSYIEGIRPSDIEPALNANIIGLFKHHYNGVRCAVLQVRNYKPKEVTIKQIELSALYLFQEYNRENIDIQERGCAVVIDGRGARLEQLRQLSLKEIRRILSVVQDGVPVRVAAAHFINLPRFSGPIFKLVMRCLKEKLRKRVHVHDNVESLHKFLDKELLPESLGGDLSDEDAFERHVIDKILEDNILLETHIGFRESDAPQPGSSIIKENSANRRGSLPYG